MIIRSIEDLKSLSETGLKKLLERIVQIFKVEKFEKIRVDIISDPCSIEYVIIEQEEKKITIAYPKLEKGQFYYDYMEFEILLPGMKAKSEYTVKKNCIYSKIISGYSDEIRLYGGNIDYLALSSKIPEVLQLFAGKNVFDMVELIPKIEEILGVSLTKFEEVALGELLLLEKGKIVGIGEYKKEYQLWLDRYKFNYYDGTYRVSLKQKNAENCELKEKDKGSDFEVYIIGNFQKLRNVTLDDIKKMTDKKKEYMEKKMITIQKSLAS